MKHKVIISQDDIKDIYIKTLEDCKMHHADKYAANLFADRLSVWIISQPNAEIEKHREKITAKEIRSDFYDLLEWLRDKPVFQRWSPLFNIEKNKFFRKLEYLVGLQEEQK